MEILDKNQPDGKAKGLPQTWALHEYTNNDAPFLMLAEKDGLKFTAWTSWQCETFLPMEKLGEVLRQQNNMHHTVQYIIRSSVVYPGESEPTTILTLIERRPVPQESTFRVAADSDAKVRWWMNKIKEMMPVVSPAADDSLEVRFWYDTDRGPVNVQRQIAVPKWGDIASNYPAVTRDALQNLMYHFRPNHGGQIILWHGPAGTGKTWSLRALCNAWRKWCTTEYILDPERLFGSSANYLMTMLMSENNPPDQGAGVIEVGEGETATIEATTGPMLGNLPPASTSTNDGVVSTLVTATYPQSAPNVKAEEQWKLLVLEDAGEMIQTDAREKIGPGLSRLLNLADGFVGQGLKTLVIITTNELIGNLHAAVSRPGRAAAIVEFGALSVEETRVWAQTHGLDEGSIPDHETMLSDLYAAKEAYLTRGKKGGQKIGFHAPMKGGAV